MFSTLRIAHSFPPFSGNTFSLRFVLSARLSSRPCSSRTASRLAVYASAPRTETTLLLRSFTRSHKSWTRATVARNHPARVVSRKTFLPYSSRQCGFRTTPRRDLPPIFALMLRPMIRIGAFLFGRSLKKWWRKKTPEEQEKIKHWFSSKRPIFLRIFGFLLAVFFGYYVTHIETDPLTNRSRLILFNKDQQETLSKLTFEVHLEELKSLLVSKSHPQYGMLVRVTDRLLNANKDLEAVHDKNWTLSVVDSPLKNAYVLPGGNIFVFLGMLNTVENDDQLAVVLAHEMAHALLKHSVEQISRGIVMDILLAIPLTIIWAVFPDFLAAVLQFVGQSVIDIFHNLPYSRALEREADEVGLKLVAKACVDVREAVVFWATMRTLTELKVEPSMVPWLSTHPDHGDREGRLNELMPGAIEVRNQHHCPRLPFIDPRKKFYELSKAELEARFKKRGLIPIP